MSSCKILKKQEVSDLLNWMHEMKFNIGHDNLVEERLWSFDKVFYSWISVVLTLCLIYIICNSELILNLLVFSSIVGIIIELIVIVNDVFNSPANLGNYIYNQNDINLINHFLDIFVRWKDINMERN